jgi:hypothetical protein
VSLDRANSPVAAARGQHARIREHMRSRAMERFGLEVGKVVRRALIRKVQTGEVKFAHKITHSRTVIVADYAGIEVTFLYNGARKEILTFLPHDARETAEWRQSHRRPCVPAVNIGI